MLSTAPNPAHPKPTQTKVEDSKPYDPASTRQAGAEAYSFASEPRAVAASRKKYRDPNEVMGDQRPPPVNIMYDRRIHRGNTYASPVIPLHAQPDPVEIQRQNEIKRRLRAKRRAEAQRRVRTPEPVDGRKHIDVQTDLYLEELSDKVPEAIAATQTDAFLDRAPSPLYVPQKSGLDVATQVLEGELFNFDYEVAPLLEVIVGKTIEQALMEVMEEEEMEMLRRHQRDHEERRNAELAEVQRLEDAERRRTEEKERRLAEQIRILKEKQEAAEKVSARAFAQAYLANLVPSVLDSLSTNGYFYDVVEKEVETLFLPWLSSEVDKSLERVRVGRGVVDEVEVLKEPIGCVDPFGTSFCGRRFGVKKRGDSDGSGRPPKLPKDPFTWVSTVWSIPESFLITTVGLDGVIFLRFLHTSAYLFTALSILGLFILVPVNYFANPLSDQQTDLDEAAYLKALTVENVPNSSPFLKVHLLFTWVFSFVAFGSLIYYYRGYVDLKLHHTEHVLRRTKLSKIELRSLIVFGIPRELRHEVDLAAYFENLGVGSVENVVICRKWNKLRTAVRNRTVCLQQLERIYFDVRRGGAGGGKRVWGGWGWVPEWVWKMVPGSNGGHSVPSSNGEYEVGTAVDVDDPSSSFTTPLLSSHRRFSTSDSADPSLFEIMNFLDAVDPRYRPRHRTGFLGLVGESVDSAGYFAERYREWDLLVHELRRSPERSAPTAVGFVTFESPESATIASQIILSRRPFACMARMAPEPRDIYWPNLSSRAADSSVKVLRGIIANSVLVFVVFLSTIAIFTLSSLNHLPAMDLERYPILKALFGWLGKNGTEVLQQVVSTLLFNAWTSSLPALLTLLSQLQGMEALSWIEMSVFSKYYFYIIYNILLYVVGRTLWDIIDKPDLNFNTIIQILGDTMPKSSPSVMSYVILQAFAIAPAQLVLAGPVILTWLLRLAPWSRTSPRDVSDAYYPSLLTSLNYGITYTIPTAVWVIGLTYSAIAPLILPFCAAFFALNYFVHKYLLLYVHLPKYESAGMHAPMAIRRCLSGLMIMQISMMGVLAFKHGNKDPATFTLMAPEWSGYVQMIVGVFPLLFCTLALFWWFREGYEKLIKNAPVELVGKVARELSRGPGRGAREQDVAPAGLGRGGGRRSADVESLLGDKSKELGDVSPRRAWMGGLGRMHRKRLQEETNGDAESLIRRGTLLGTELLSPLQQAQQVLVDPNEVPPSPSSSAGPQHHGLGSSALVSFLEPESSPTSMATMVGAAPITPTRDSFASSSYYRREDDATYSIFEEPSEAEADHVSDVEELSDGEDLPSAPLEPPSTRVPGILDAPLQPSVIPEGDEDENMLRSLGAATSAAGVFDAPDLQLHTYMHPALIGRLPVAWLPDSQTSRQPRRLREAREEQVRMQRTLFRRIVGLQRVGVAAAAIGETGEEEEEEGRGPRGILGKVRSFFDGMSSWAHMQITS
ncbi:Radial spoke head protein 3 [Dinochytrium kinnereticum]|nr:Radial spoke head protein 3 [Dinochytrium kinnereticum]